MTAGQPPPGHADRRDRKEHAVERHPLDAVSLGFGVLFAATGLLFLSGRVPAVELRWLAPLAILALGLWLLLSVVVTGRRTGTGESDGERDIREGATGEVAAEATEERRD